MPRHRQPSNVLVLKGAFAKNKKRFADRVNEPKPNGPVGEPPDYLTEDEARCWREIVAEAPAGVLGDADRGLLTIAAGLRMHIEKGGDPVNVAPRGEPPVYEHVTDTKKIALLIRCYTELGMTPASRSKVQVPPAKEEENAFAAV